MTQLQTRHIVDTLSAWMSGNQLADDLVPRTQALLAELLTTKPQRKVVDTCQIVDTASLSDAELFAHYKRISLREDVRFFLEHTTNIAESTRQQASVLLSELGSRKTTAADRKLYNRLTDEWRRASWIRDPNATEAGDRDAHMYKFYRGEIPSHFPCLVKDEDKPMVTTSKRARADRRAEQAA